MHLLRYTRDTIMSIFSERSPLLFLLDSERVFGRSIMDYRLDTVEFMYGRMAEGSEKSLLITELVWLKQYHSTPQHEYIVVSVQGPNSRLYYLAIGRLEDSGSSTNCPPSTPASSTASSSTLYSNSQQHESVPQAASTGPILGIQNVRDMVVILPTQGCGGDPVLARLSCPNSEFYLHHLVVLADMMHKQDPNYHLLDANCFWFLRKIVDTIEVAFEAVVVEEVQPMRLHGILPQYGQWTWSLVRTRLSEDVVDELRYDWQESCDIF